MFAALISLHYRSIDFRGGYLGSLPEDEWCDFGDIAFH